MPFVFMMHEIQCTPGESTLFMHHADPSGVYQPHSVGMMHECSPELLARAAFMQHDDKEIMY